MSCPSSYMNGWHRAISIDCKTVLFCSFRQRLDLVRPPLICEAKDLQQLLLCLVLISDNSTAPSPYVRRVDAEMGIFMPLYLHECAHLLEDRIGITGSCMCHRRRRCIDRTGPGRVM